MPVARKIAIEALGGCARPTLETTEPGRTDQRQPTEALPMIGRGHDDVLGRQRQCDDVDGRFARLVCRLADLLELGAIEGRPIRRVRPVGRAEAQPVDEDHAAVRCQPPRQCGELGPATRGVEAVKEQHRPTLAQHVTRDSAGVRFNGQRGAAYGRGKGECRHRGEYDGERCPVARPSRRSESPETPSLRSADRCGTTLGAWIRRLSRRPSIPGTTSTSPSVRRPRRCSACSSSACRSISNPSSGPSGSNSGPGQTLRSRISCISSASRSSS